MDLIHTLILAVTLSSVVAVPLSSSGFQTESQKDATTKVPTDQTAVIDSGKTITPKPTTESVWLGIKVVIDENPTIPPLPLKPLKPRCYRIGQKAAKLGYQCYVNLAIVERRENMPQRYKMKMLLKGPKWGYAFARKLQFCAKSRKQSSLFYRGCNKEASAMDNVQQPKPDYIFNSGK